MEDGRQRRYERQGGNLRAIRERKGISQAGLARQMNERGHSWHQSTVHRVESGVQPLTLLETEDLASILGAMVAQFTWEPAEINESQFVYAAGYQVRQSWDAVADAVFRLMLARGAAGRVATQHRHSKYERTQEAILDVRARMREHQLEAAFWEGVDRYERRGEPDEGG